MGILKDNDDNLEDENLTFFFDGSKKLNEFVLNKDLNINTKENSNTLASVVCHPESIDGALGNDSNSSDSSSSSNSDSNSSVVP